MGKRGWAGGKREVGSGQKVGWVGGQKIGWTGEQKCERGGQMGKRGWAGEQCYPPFSPLNNATVDHSTHTASAAVYIGL